MTAICQLYQMKDTAENRRYLFKSYRDILENGGSIQSDQYTMVYESPIAPDASISEVKRLFARLPRKNQERRALSNSDVIVVKKSTGIESYFVDPIGLIPMANFLHNQLLTPSTKHYSIPGKPGFWIVADTFIVDHTMFYLMEDEERRNEKTSVVLDTLGRIITDNWDEKTLRKTQSFLHVTQEDRRTLKRPSIRQRLNEKLAIIHG